MSAGDQARKSKSQRLGPHVARALAIKNLLDVLPCLSAHERLVSSLVQASAPFKGSRVQAIPQHVVDRAGSDGLLAPTIPQSCGPRFLGDRKSTTSELQSLVSISYAVFCLKKKNTQ